MNDHTVLVFTRNGLGDAPAELQQKLAAKFLQLNLDANTLCNEAAATLVCYR